jgi:hypothetical protein
MKFLATEGHSTITVADTLFEAVSNPIAAAAVFLKKTFRPWLSQKKRANIYKYAPSFLPCQA